MPKNKLEVVAARMSVCGECGDLSGAFEDATQVHRVQDCGCPGSKGRDDEPPWPRYDFNRVVELCRCCAGSLVPSGSRWSSFFCDACNTNVVAWNRARAGGIPVGRHSLANGIGCPALPGGPREEEETEEPIPVAPFARRLHGLWARTRYLDQWRLRRVRDVLGKTNGRASVPDYLAAVRAGPARREIFAELVSYFEVRAVEVDAAGEVIVHGAPRRNKKADVPHGGGPLTGFPSWADITALYFALTGRVDSPEEEAASKAHYDKALAEMLAERAAEPTAPPKKKTSRIIERGIDRTEEDVGAETTPDEPTKPGLE